MSKDSYLFESIDDQKRFFGRRCSKSLSLLQKSLYTQAQKEIFFDNKDNLCPHSLFLRNFSKIIIEIGFGDGIHLVHQAKTFEDVGFIGIDAYINGVSKLIKSIHTNNLDNIRISDSDAFQILKTIPDNSIDGLYLLYPDPWPKNRHRHRRFIQRDTAQQIERILKKDAFFKFASDIPEYCDWVMAAFFNSTQMILNTEAHYTQFFDNWIQTKYERKAISEGRIGHYYHFLKRK